MHRLPEGRLLRGPASEQMAQLHSAPESNKDFLQAECRKSACLVWSELEEGDKREPVVKGGAFLLHNKKKAGKREWETGKGGQGVCTWALCHQGGAQLLSLCHSWHARLVPDLSLHCGGHEGRSPPRPPTKTNRQRLASESLVSDG